jgi:hypothetical protein
MTLKLRTTELYIYISMETGRHRRRRRRRRRNNRIEPKTGTRWKFCLDAARRSQMEG